MTSHQKEQLAVINKLEQQARDNSLDASVVEPVKNFEEDSRICLTSIHFPYDTLKAEIEEIISTLKNISPEHYYYGKDSLHITIKNIRVINDPPHFTPKDVEAAERVFSAVIPHHKKFKIYYYRLLLLPNNLALIGTTDEELDNLILDLDEKLKKSGVQDDKKYINSKYFFSNITLARFLEPVSEEFRNKVRELSERITINPYTIDSVSLITATAVLKKLDIINTWRLRS